MPKPNHICKNPKCGKPYYACESCEKIGSWKAVACSPSCFQDYIRMIDEQTKPHKAEAKTVEIEEPKPIEEEKPKVKAKAKKKKVTEDESVTIAADE